MEHKHHENCISWTVSDSLSFSVNTYEYYALHDYLPSNMFPNDKILQEDIQKRQYIWDFKKGFDYATIRAIKELEQMILNIGCDLTDVIFIPIPASTQYKTNIRFKNFCNGISRRLNVQNGFGAIITADHEPKKGSSGIKIEHFTFHPDFYKGKNVILFDDIITTEETFKQTADMLMQGGALSVKGIFLAKTVHKYNE
ncbi:MAG: hypothetical protein E6767_07925 [Dysgonomonas sp.]|nr:hypothetical protein [Dysgonomonas sp.]